MGTHTHAAPELLRSGHLSPAVDAYAFGVLGERWEGRREGEAGTECACMI